MAGRATLPLWFLAQGKTLNNSWLVNIPMAMFTQSYGVRVDWLSCESLGNGATEMGCLKVVTFKAYYDLVVTGQVIWLSCSPVENDF